MGKKKSKCCCIYKKKKAWDDDDDSSDDSVIIAVNFRAKVERLEALILCVGKVGEKDKEGVPKEDTMKNGAGSQMYRWKKIHGDSSIYSVSHEVNVGRTGVRGSNHGSKQ
ncbi:hypothetical protein NECAME_16603 [Necator americanus]|uniref:Uncharacterized protein n=1 Tax=Necator americanus TaxID=51031 RepID=W2TXV5_NECAM|nr:hypothetical protein NECAME_16603 [Necator americanus]ETN85847.1 hypothetical protein NECAME_16603 [Necator americanus]